MWGKLREKIRSFRGPAARYWGFYVLGCSLLNLWAALLWGWSSWDPFKTVITDGSMIVFCFGAMWLTLADLNRELRRANPSRDSVFWDTQQRFQGWAILASIAAMICYAQYMTQETNLDPWGRIVISSAALLVGLIYAAQAIAATHQIAEEEGHR